MYDTSRQQSAQALRDLPTLLNAAGIDIGAYNLPGVEMPTPDLLSPLTRTPFETVRAVGGGHSVIPRRHSGTGVPFLLGL